MSYHDSRSHHHRSGGRYESSSRSRYGSSSSMGGGRMGRMPRPKNEFGIAMGQSGSSLRAPDWASMDLPPFQKEFYREHPDVASQTDEEVAAWRAKHQIITTGAGIPRPVRTFEEAGFPDYILTEIKRAGFEKPTPIQSQGWPMAMSGRDVIGIAKTGSGKTLAFLLPSIVHINAQPLLRKGDGPIVLTIAPTRELAVQIQSEASKFGYSSRIKMTCVYGGVSRRDQAYALREGVEIIICTPGRLLDFLESNTTNLRRVTYLVIDEADRLLDMGFEPQLKAILSQVRPDRQILMWSATWPKEVQSLAREIIREDTIQVSVGSLEVHANHDVTQIIEILENYEKSQKLYRILKEHVGPNGSGGAKVLVFLATKRSCDSLCRQLRQDGYPALAIHGDKPQHERDWVLSQFKTGASSIMLATDVASRGIHVDDISLVVNYDFPGNIEDYVHRIGRTGRCGKKGMAISFFTRQDGKRAQPLLKVLEEAHQHIPPKLQHLSREFMSERSHTRYRRRDRGYGGPNSSRSSMSSSSMNNVANNAAASVLSYSQGGPPNGHMPPAGYPPQFAVPGGAHPGGPGGPGGYPASGYTQPPQAGYAATGPAQAGQASSNRFAPY